ncbi:zinc finger protein 888-like [Trichogramma pretiosum]|uniref:zinc finger protein 888-like n=1 Tax=Trichogramma pretiosum TaxID=7493 RepID=UPI000C71BFF5|nr:zinc finger protein 888-like [Trichogramma pretiosum]
MDNGLIRSQKCIKKFKTPKESSYQLLLRQEQRQLCQTTPLNCVSLRESYKCDECDRTFRKRDYFLLHREVVHHQRDKIPRNYECRLCNKRFSLRSLAADHFDKAHRGTKRHKCEVCAKTFQTMGGLKLHLYQAHLKQYKCRQCKQVLKIEQADEHSKIECSAMRKLKSLRKRSVKGG